MNSPEFWKSVVLAVSLAKLQLSFSKPSAFFFQVFGHAVLAKIILKHLRNTLFERVSAGVKIRVEEAVLRHKDTLYG